MKYRPSKTKQQHSMIKGLKKSLDRLQKSSSIHSIIPGPIRPHSRTKEFKITIQYETNTGFKCVARGDNATQDVFFVVNDKEIFKKELEKMFGQ